IIAVVAIVTLIVPQILSKLPLGTSLPLPTRIVQGVAALFAGYWWAILPAVLLAILGVARAFANPQSRLWIDRRLLSAPLLGPLLRDVAVARFTRTLGTLTSAGIPILQAL